MTRDPLRVLVDSGRRWEIERIPPTGDESETRHRGVMYGPDGQTSSLITPICDTPAEAMHELATRYEWLVGLANLKDDDEGGTP